MIQSVCLIVFTVDFYPDKSSKTMNESIWEERKCEPWPPCFKLLNTEYLVAWEEVNQSWFLQRVRTCSTNHIFLPNANDILECRIKTRITLTEHEWIWLKFFIWYFLRCTVLILSIGWIPENWKTFISKPTLLFLSGKSQKL